MFVIDRDAAIGREDSQPAKQVLDNALVRKVNAWNKTKLSILMPVRFISPVGYKLTLA